MRNCLRSIPLYMNYLVSWSVWWYSPASLSTGRLKQEDCKVLSLCLCLSAPLSFCGVCSVYVCIWNCAYLWSLEDNTGYWRHLHCYCCVLVLRQGLSALINLRLADLADWTVDPGDLLVSTSPVLGLQIWAITPVFFVCLFYFEIRSYYIALADLVLYV